VYVAVITPPTDALASLAEAKAHLRVDHDDDNDRIQALIWAAQNEFAGPDGWVGRSVSLQTLELRLNMFPGCGDIELPCPPLLVDVDHPLTVKYTDVDGAEQTVDSAIYSIVTSGGAGIARVALNYRSIWPSPRWQADAVRVRYQAGYAADDKRAEGLKSAIKLHVELNYDDVDAEKWRRAIDQLLSTYRLY
jgi:uncharacterized phiE125 gp8 family phage protein